MPIKQKDRNRKELVKAIVAQSKGKIFTVVAKRKTPKSYFIIGKLLQADASINSIMLVEGDKHYLSTKKSKQMLIDLKHAGLCELSEHTEYFMEMTGRTGVKKDLKPLEVIGQRATEACKYADYSDGDVLIGQKAFEAMECTACKTEPVYEERKSTLQGKEDLVSINLTNGKGYRSFSAYNVLQIRSGGAEIKFKEADVLAFEGE